MMRPPAWVMVLAAVVWHLLWVASVFDIYFTSPVVSGCHPQPLPPSLPRPAARVVLFVADGMRADRFFELDSATGRPRAPFVRQRAIHDGAWGVSHTHVPTESRPGHVALLGGLYEDVSAITRGWRSNPVSFDTLFNRSSYSFLLGSPDIVPMFADPLPPDRHTALTYSAAFEDFAGDPGLLDAWVRDAWEREVAPHPRVCEEQSLQLLHLLGTDTSGHAFRPTSPHYLAMVGRVDAVVQAVYERMEAACPDGRTAYIVTADHGMSDKGSHGAGDPSETETPLILWGSGVRGPLPAQPALDPPNPRAWALDHVQRRDVEQADVAPLIAALLGIATPVHSVGVVPQDLLALSPPHALAVAAANARQLLEQLRVKQQRLRDRAWVRHPPAREAELRAAVAVASSTDTLHALIVEVVRELARCDGWEAPWLLTVATLGLAGWMLQVLLWLAHVPHTVSRAWRVVQALLWAGATLLLGRQGAPVTHLLYVGWAVWVTGDALVRLRALPWPSRPLAWFGAAVALEVMVWGFYQRSAYAALLVAAALVGGDAAHSASLALLAIFPLLPSAMSDAPTQVVAALVASGAAALAVLPPSRLRQWHLGSLAAVMVCVVWDHVRRLAHLPLHPLAQWLGWAQLLGNGWALSRVAHQRPPLLHFALHVYLCVVPVYALLSVAYEALALVALALALAAWVRRERRQAAHHDALRPAVMYVLLTYAAFFGTGNTGSLSSFEISSTYRLITVFSPFVMGALLLLKAALPFVLVGVAYGAIVKERHRAFFVVLLLSDVMALNFFFLVRNHGSWREIGLSISHFGMANGHVLFQLLMFGLPHWLGMGDV